MASVERNTTLNARVSAWTLVIGTFFQALLSTSSLPLTPMHLLALAIITTGAWAFVDEMGAHKPLVRAGFVVFCGAAFARAIALIDVSSASLGRFYLLYAYASMLAMFMWSVAYLHRQRTLKVAGSVGVLASLAPIAALIAGHIFVGAGALFGIDALMPASEGANLTNYAAINAVDYLLCGWAVVTAWFLLSGRIHDGASV